MTNPDLPTPRGNAGDQATREVNLLLTGIPSSSKGSLVRAARVAGHILAQRDAGGEQQW